MRAAIALGLLVLAAAPVAAPARSVAALPIPTDDLPF